MVKKPSLWQRISKPFKFDEEDSAIQNNMVQKVSLHIEPVGSSGTEIYSGYFQEEYLSELRGTEAADLWDKMRRNDAIIKMVLNAVKHPIKAANWYFEPASDSYEDKYRADFMSHILFNDMDQTWSESLHEILSFVDFGFSIFEITNKVVLGNQQWGNYNGIRSLGFRSQRTIERWNLDYITGKLVSVDQYAYGDTQRLVTIPAEHLLTFSLDKEGDNYEGISALRACYGAWKRKQGFLKLIAVGSEKYAIPTPVLEVPDDKYNSTQYSNAINVLKKYVAHQQQYITRPTGWNIEFIKTDFKANEIRLSVEAENIEIVKAFLANFLLLGGSQSSTGGSYALSFDQSDFFLGGLEQVAKLIYEQINKYLVPKIMKLNFGNAANMPKLKCSGISDKAGMELAQAVKLLIDSKVVIPDDKLEANLRERFNLPLKSEEGQREVSKVEPLQSLFQSQSQPALSEGYSISLSDPKKQIKEAKDEVAELMQSHLFKINQSLVDQIVSNRKSLPESKRFDAVKGLTNSGENEYKRELLELLSREANKSIQQARKEVPPTKNIRLSDVPHGTIRLSEFDKLPTDLQNRLKLISQLLVGTQLSDLHKKLQFAYLSTVDSTDSQAVLEKDLKDTGVTFIAGPAIANGAGTILGQVVNEARNAFFYDEKTLEEIESFTFVNGDPVSPICQALAGTTFEKDDPDLRTYQPPLHFNCKSYIVPNLVGATDRKVTDKDDDWHESVGAAQSSINLAEAKCNFTMQSVKVSKKLANSLADAQRYAKEYGADTQNYITTEDAYFFTQKDPSLFVEGTLKTFEPLEGIWLFFGMLKDPESLGLAEIENPRSGNLQTIIISKDVAKTLAQAKAIAKEFGAKNLDVDETETSFRFRQRNPTDFKEGSFRTKPIPEKGVSLVYGQLK